ncbi:hypothetical protein LCGC14_1018110 [marine sediment metagenome]|uniref:Uncharacterized protein n=1 Tax=marine sediment metagenome TaxID=412755 RepID=A0A0F9NJY1_9ZZZZ
MEVTLPQNFQNLSLSFATSWIRAGGYAKRLQHMLGHADPRVVRLCTFNC